MFSSVSSSIKVRRKPLTFIEKFMETWYPDLKSKLHSTFPVWINQWTFPSIKDILQDWQYTHTGHTDICTLTLINGKIVNCAAEWKLHFKWKCSFFTWKNSSRTGTSFTYIKTVIQAHSLGFATRHSGECRSV